MLLFQYGVYDFGQGLSFRLDITRQIIREEALGDDDIVQLSLVLHYAPSSFASIGDFNRWSIDAPSMAAFVDDAKTTAGYLQASRAVLLRVEIGASTV